ncbi:hypothetical protein [Rufibacter tibetensis]|uniref:Uncharacterized protein n=1 Tax=Rufibacter tibetensis TaxID=512763 RepID=A0A0P0CPC3_9BACT|nr:hypothetical protein [Rufibacter tibetensis]ALI98122.1 hypothetical protein DC20_02930 [Rufibacter tibetensis]
MKSRKHLNFPNKEEYVTILLVIGIVIGYLFGARPTFTTEQSYLRAFQKEIKDCGAAEKLALKEVEQGELQLIVMSGFDSDTAGMPYAFYQKLSKEYGVKLVYLYNCVPMLGQECYNEQMYLAINNKFGREHISKLYETLHVAHYGPR